MDFRQMAVGMEGAFPAIMAAVLALVMLPTIASIGFFLGVIRIDGSLASATAGALFVALAVGVLVGALRVAGGDGGSHHAHG